MRQRVTVWGWQKYMGVYWGDILTQSRRFSGTPPGVSHVVEVLGVTIETPFLAPKNLESSVRQDFQVLACS